MKITISQELLISLVVFQFLIFYGTADFTKSTAAPQNIWDKVWYVTEGITYTAFAWYGYSKSEGKFRKIWKILARFLTLRAIWELYSVIFGWDVNMKIAMAIMFAIISLISLSIILFHFSKKIWQR